MLLATLLIASVDTLLNVVIAWLVLRWWLAYQSDRKGPRDVPPPPP